LRKLFPLILVLAGHAPGQTAPEAGIPVNDPLVISKCGSCHTRDEHGNMQRISWERATPEGWEQALKRMIRLDGVVLSPPEARAIIQYLSTYHGLAPEEAQPVAFFAERRVQEETGGPNDAVRRACSRCHAFASALSWRRSPGDWKELGKFHATLNPDAKPASVDDQAIAFLSQAAPLHTPAWDAWSAHLHAPNLAGRWLVSAHLPGHGTYYGEMNVEASGDEFNTRVKLQSVQDGSTILRSGRGLVYAGYAWRGRSQSATPASSAPDDLRNEMREVVWIAPDQSSAVGRWFWGRYQEFGLDVKLRRATGDPSLLAVDRRALKIGSKASRIRLIGDNLPAPVTPSDLSLGPGVTVQRIVSATRSEIAAEVDVAANAAPGKRDVTLRGAALPDGIAIYDRVDYIKVLPESAVVQFGDDEHARSYQQFEAIGYQRGADGQPHTADDVELGPLDATWSLEEFSWSPGGSKPSVGTLSPTGLFTPASSGPRNNYDLWVIAEATNETNKDGKPPAGKSYLVVSVPAYTLNGRHYVRELGRWVEDRTSPP